MKEIATIVHIAEKIIFGIIEYANNNSTDMELMHRLAVLEEQLCQIRKITEKEEKK